MRWICLGLAALTLACFGHACLGEFINFDDPLYITENPHVLGGLTWANAVWALGESCRRAGYWIPLTWLSLELDASLFGPSGAWGFHLTNVLLHAANVVAFYWVLQRMTGDSIRSAAAAALFGLHPLRVESVAWVTERKDVLSTLFLILTLAAYLRYAEAPSWRRYALVFAMFFLGLSAKPTLVTLPFALLLLDYWPLGRVRWGQSVPVRSVPVPVASIRWLVLEKLPMLSAVAAVVPITLHYASEAIVANVPWLLRIRIALASYLGYIEISFWPVNLAMLYPGKLPTGPQIALAILVLAAITAGAICLARPQPAVMVGWFWFLGTMFPTSGIVQTGPQALADRYTYVPHLGLALAVVWGVSDTGLWRRLSMPTRRAIAGLLLASLAALTWMQVGYWRDSATLFAHTLSVTKDNYLVRYCLAGYWQQQGNLEEAEKEYLLAIELEPRDFRAHYLYGQMLISRLDRPASAAEQLRIALGIEPENPDAHYWFGIALSNLGRTDEARHAWQTAVRYWQTRSQTEFLGNRQARQAQPYLALAELDLRQGHAEQALANVRRAQEIRPGHAETLQLMAIALGRLERWPEAAQLLQEARAQEPDNASTRGYLAFANARQGKKEESAREYAGVLKDYPDWPEKTADFALAKITEPRLRDPLTARELAWQICEATDFKDARWLNVLAAAHAGNGDFAKARTIARQALDLMPPSALAAELRDRLRLYENNQALPPARDGH